VLSAEDFRETEFYAGWFTPNGWLHGSSVAMVEVCLAGSVSSSGHPFTPDEVAVYKSLAPHSG
jgi:hypothetical protein